MNDLMDKLGEATHRNEELQEQHQRMKAQTRRALQLTETENQRLEKRVEILEMEKHQLQRGSAMAPDLIAQSQNRHDECARIGEAARSGAAESATCMLDTTKNLSSSTSTLQVTKRDDGPRWRQNADEVEITCMIPSLAKDGKRFVNITFACRKLRVQVRDVILFESSLCGPTKVSDSTWTLCGGVLQVTLMKAMTVSWATLEG